MKLFNEFNWYSLRKLKHLFLFLIAAESAKNVASAATTTGKTYYVATNGSDSNPGSSTKPWKTIFYAAGKIVAGDTVYVRSGVYNNGNIWLRRSGTSTAPIRLLAAPGESPVITCNSAKPYHGILVENSTKVTNIYKEVSPAPIGWINIEGFEIRGCLTGMRLNYAYKTVIRKNWIHHNKSQGILGSMKDVTIDRNRINHNGHFADCAADIAAGITGGSSYSCNKDHGMYITGTNYKITNNLIYGNLGTGIQVAGYPYDMSLYGGAGSRTFSSHRGSDPTFSGASGWIIANNTIAYQNYGPAIVLWQKWTVNNKIINNIFYENGSKSPTSGTNGVGFTSLADGGKGHVIQNNLFYASGSGATKMFGTGGVKGVHYVESGNRVGLPLFVSAPATLPSSPNFMLKSQSPAINKGLSTTATKIDFRGAARPRGGAYDIGAYEY